MPFLSKSSVTCSVLGLALTIGVVNAQTVNIEHYIQYSPFVNRNRLCCAPTPTADCFGPGQFRDDKECYIRDTTAKEEGFDTFRLAIDSSNARVTSGDGERELSCIYSIGSSIPGIAPEFEHTRFYWQLDSENNVLAKSGLGCPVVKNGNVLPGRYFYIPPESNIQEFSPTIFMGSNNFRTIGLDNDGLLVAKANTPPLRAALAGGGLLMEYEEYRFSYRFEGSSYSLGCKKSTVYDDRCILSGEKGNGSGKFTFVPKGGPNENQNPVIKGPPYCLFWQNANGELFKLSKPPVESGVLGYRVTNSDCDDGEDVRINGWYSSTVVRGDMELLFSGYYLRLRDSYVSVVHSPDEKGSVAAYNAFEYGAS